MMGLKKAALLLAGVAGAAAFNPYVHEMELAMAPVPQQMHSPTMMLACVDGMSTECQKILNDINAKSGPSTTDEDWSYGDGYYLDNFGDIDENADIGVVEMPYQVCELPILYRQRFSPLLACEMDYDLLQSHLIGISGVKPCGACGD